MCLLRCGIAQMFIWIDLMVLARGQWALDVLIICLLQELYGFGQVKDGHVILFHLHMDQAHVVEVVLGVWLVRLLVHRV